MAEQQPSDASAGETSLEQHHHNHKVAPCWNDLPWELIQAILCCLTPDWAATYRAARLVCSGWATASAAGVEALVLAGSHRPVPPTWTRRFVHLKRIAVKDSGMSLAMLAREEEWARLWRLTSLRLEAPLCQSDADCIRQLPNLRHLRISSLQCSSPSPLGDEMKGSGMKEYPCGSPHVDCVEATHKLMNRLQLSARDSDLPDKLGLESLEIVHCDNFLTDVGLTSLVAQLPLLQSLRLGACIAIADEGARAISKLTQMTHLSLDGAALTEKGLLALARLPRLSRVSLKQSVFLSPSAVTAWLATLTCPLLELELTGCMDDSTVSVLAICCPNLERLSAEGCHALTDSGAASIGCLTKLTSLSLRSCCQVSDAALHFIPELPHLRTLNLVNTAASDGCLRNLLPCSSRLENLRVGRDEFCHFLAHRNMHRRGCNITDVGMQAVACLQSLRTLGVYDCDLVTGAGIARLTALQRLQELRLKWNIDDNALAVLPALTSLRTLSLTGASQVTCKGLRYLDQMAQLTSFELSECHDLTELEPLSGITTLQSLSVSACHAMGAGILPALMCLKRLRKLTLGSVTGKGDIVNSLRERHPSLRQLSFSFATTTTVHL